MNIYVIEGGIGRHIFFTALIPKLAEKEQIMVMSSYPDIFDNNPHVYRSLNRGTSYAWEDIVKKPENKICYSDPYFNDDFIKGNVHVIKAWCDQFGIKYNDEMLPNVYPMDIHIDQAKRFKKEQGSFIIVQFRGGQSPFSFAKDRPFIYDGFQRNYSEENAQKLVKIIKEEYPDLKIIDFSLANESKELEGTMRFEAPYLFYRALLDESLGFIGINSSLIHMAACTNVKGIALWGGSDPAQWGYKKHINISGKCKHNKLYCTRPYLRDLGDFMGSGAKWSCGKPSCMDISPLEIANELRKIIPKDKIKPVEPKPAVLPNRKARRKGK